MTSKAIALTRQGGGSRSFLGLRISDPGIDGLIDWLVKPDPTTIKPRAVAYLNAHTVNLALRKGSSLKAHYAAMDLVYPDGMSIVREAGRMGISIRERVSAGDFFQRFCWSAASEGRTLAFVGGEDDLAYRCAEHLKNRIAGLNIVYTHHGYVPEGSPDRNVLKLALKEINPDIVLIGMGSPQQEHLALELRNAGHPTTWCVGALFEYFTPGVRNHAPLWMRDNGLEWLYRLSQEPGRLGRRYLLGNLEFLIRARLRS